MRMLTKICSVCLRSGILCQKCEEKVRLGEVSELDLKVARILSKIEEKYPILESVSLHKATEADDVLVIIVNKQDVQKLLSHGGKILRELSEKIGKKKVKVLANEDSPRRFLENLFAPASILTINTVWLPDGSMETKVLIPKKDARKLPLSIQTLKNIVKAIRGINLRVEFEDYKGRI